jgi:hypothetical protein
MTDLATTANKAGGISHYPLGPLLHVLALSHCELWDKLDSHHNLAATPVMTRAVYGHFSIIQISYIN